MGKGKTIEIQTRLRHARKLHEEGKVAAAAREYRKILEQVPRDPLINYVLGIALLQSNNPGEALKHLKLTTRLKPDHTASWSALGRAHAALRQFDEAHSAFTNALRLDPGASLPARGLGALLAREGKWDELLQLIRGPAARFADEPAIVSLDLRARVATGDSRTALARYFAFRKSQPDAPLDYDWLHELLLAAESTGDDPLPPLRSSSLPRTLYGCATACIRSGRPGQALRFLKLLRKHDPSGAGVPLLEVGAALVQCKAPEEAEAVFWVALEQDPFNDRTLNYLAHTLRELASKNVAGKFLEAKELMEAGLRRNPDDVENLSLLADIWMQASCPALALPEFERAFALQRPTRTRHSAYLFNLNYAEDRPAERIFAAHREWSRLHEPPVPRSSPDPIDPDPERRLRIGYVSPDFTFHPVSYFFLPILEAHDPARVEVFLYSNRKRSAKPDAMAGKLRAAADHWRDVFEKNDDELEDRIRADRIDILVDLAGHSGNNRLPLFIRRPAPVQVSWLGYPNTTGLRSIDYRFSDAIVEPPGPADARSSETIYRLPNGFHVFRMPEPFPEVGALPALRNGHLTFGSFNNLNKVGIRTIRLWARLLKAVPDSILYVKHQSLNVLANRERLLSSFALFGIPPTRLKLTMNKRSNTRHLLCYHEVDVALDPLAYNGTTTTCESLLMGVPVLTLPGETHASRVSASLLHRVGLDDWVARDEQDFLRIAASLTDAPERLADLRRNLRTTFFNSPLGDAGGLANAIEQAYRQMWMQRRRTTGASPATGFATESNIRQPSEL